MAKEKELTALLQPLVEQLDYEFVGLEYQPAPGSALLRVYIDRAAGITVDDCASISREVASLMDVHDPIRGEYTLEVSSPGMDRPLFTVEHYERFVGEQAKLTIGMPIDGRRKFKGPIVRVEDSAIVLDQDGSEIRIDHSNVIKARLVPQF
nr:ribosome maturation factor RimP-like [Nerophis lumbriciformis]